MIFRRWRHMNSAPKTGETILVERRDWSSTSMALAFWHEGQNFPCFVFADGRDRGKKVPDWYELWQPLPKRPKFSTKFWNTYQRRNMTP